MITKHYKVAGHVFAVSGKAELFEQMGNYEPFECEGGEPLFSLTIECGVVPEYTEEFRFEIWSNLIYGHTASGNVVFVNEGRRNTSCLICSKDYHEGRLIITGDISKGVLASLKFMFILATAGQDTLLLHAVVVSCEGKGYIFLGPSGTGKSTHARLWLEHIEGTELVNDDSPVVRGGMVYGSPWGSFNTPCYRNVSYPIGGIVSLSQASCNKIHRISGIETYLTLYCRDIVSFLGYSIPEDIAEGMHQTKDKLAQTIPMWHLECLPDEEAARLCHDTIMNDGM